MYRYNKIYQIFFSLESNDVYRFENVYAISCYNFYCVFFCIFQACFTVLNNKGIKTQYVIDDLKQLKRDAIFNRRKIAFITNFVTISILKHH